MRTTIDISDALLRELRNQAASSNRPFRAIVEETLQRGLANLSGALPKRKIKITPHPVGIKAPYRAMSMNQLYDELESNAIRGIK